MNNLTRFLNRFQRRTLLIAVAVLLLLLNLGRWVISSYDIRKTELESKLARLEQVRFVAGQSDILKERLAKTDKAKKQVEVYFFRGESGEKIASAMQLRVQALVSQAGLASESIRPTNQPSDKNRDFGGEQFLAPGEVNVKARLVGTLEEFMMFQALLYKSKEFFKIEKITLKPYKKAGLKIFLELRGFYILAEKPVAEVSEASEITDEVADDSSGIAR